MQNAKILVKFASALVPIYNLIIGVHSTGVLYWVKCACFFCFFKSTFNTFQSGLFYFITLARIIAFNQKYPEMSHFNQSFKNYLYDTFHFISVEYSQ